MFIIETGEVSMTKKGRDRRGAATGEIFRIGRLGETQQHIKGKAGFLASKTVPFFFKG